MSSDRIIALTVVLEADIREEQAQPIVDAISLITGVAEVLAVKADTSYHIAKSQVRTELANRLFSILREP